MRTVHKFELQVVGEQRITIDKYFRPLMIGLQNGKVQMWAEVDATHKPIAVPIYMFRTGHDIPSYTINHLGSVQDGSYVWHFYAYTKVKVD